LQKVIRDSEIGTKETICNKSTQILAYADDTVTVGRTIGALKKTMKKLRKAEQVMGLAVNMKKTKYVEITQKPTNINMLKTDSQNMRG
jgi:hypothetical protein